MKMPINRNPYQPKSRFKKRRRRPNNNSQPKVWQEPLNSALSDLSEGKTDGFRVFLDRFAGELSSRELVAIRNKLIPKVRNKTKGVLGGAALKAHARRVRDLFDELQEIIDAKQKDSGNRTQDSAETRKLKIQPQKPSRDLVEEYLNPPTADEMLAKIESVDDSAHSSKGLKKSFLELEKAFKALMLSGRLEFIKSEGRYNITEIGQSTSTEINSEVNQELCRAYKEKIEALREAESKLIEQEITQEESRKKLEEKRKKEVQEAAERKSRKDAAMPGIFGEAEVNGARLRLYIGETMSSNSERLRHRNPEENKERSDDDQLIEGLIEENYDEIVAYEADLAKKQTEDAKRSEREARARKKAQKQAKKSEKAKQNNQNKEDSKAKKQKKSKKAVQAVKSVEPKPVNTNLSNARRLVMAEYKGIQKFIECRNAEIKQLVEVNNLEPRQFIRVDQVISGKSKLTPGSTYEIGKNGIPQSLQKALALLRGKMIETIDVDQIVDAIKPFKEVLSASASLKCEEEQKLAA